MTSLRTLASAILCTSALLPFGAAHAVVTYTGYASADNFNPDNRLQDSDYGTTPAPASYGVNVDGNVATAWNDSAHGGTVYSYASSAGAYSTTWGFTYGGVASSSASVSFRVTMLGPDVPGTIPVHITASGYVNGAGSTQASVSFVVNPQTGGSLLVGGTSLNSPAGNSFLFDQIVGIRPNAFFDVSLYTNTLSGGSGDPAGWSEAFVDPTFTIDDPAYASAYHFDGIPSITAGVPEPATGVLAMLGLGVIGAACRRRQDQRRLACRKRRAFSQSRATVRTARPNTPAISISVMPAK